MHERRSVRLNSKAGTIAIDSRRDSLAQRRDRCNSVIFPEPLTSASKEEEATLEDVPNPEALSKWLLEKGGLSTEEWGKAAGTKGVAKYWKELKEGESGLELWKKEDGSTLPVRVTHVLRAKVCSPQSYDKGMFLFNTWQQMADGTRRLRNGLLSEKLMTCEVPLREHLHEVCQRAVTQEEMQCVVDGGYSIPKGGPLPPYNPEYTCPIKVETENFVDYTTEVETSKSYPGLMTLYHLYTVEIICSGLPGFDFNTLEYDHEDKDGQRKLKYVHAWVWLEWSQIRRYLFEGSTLKERKTKGSFADPRALSRWLGQFDLDLNAWGNDGRGSVQDLFNEVEDEETQLELWNREDGVPLLMRVVHVLQLKVQSSEKALFGKFLFQSFTQGKDGRVKPVNRLMAKKLSSAQMPFDETRFIKAAEEAVQRQLSHLMDAHFHMDPSQPLEASQFPESGVRIRNTEFKSHHFDVEDSPSFRGMHTMYHLYGMELECEKLPRSDFTSLDLSHPRGPYVNFWKWVCWPETLDVLHHRIRGLERQYQATRQVLSNQRRRIQDSTDSMERLEQQVQSFQDDTEAELTPAARDSLEEVVQLTQELHDELQELHEVAEIDHTNDPESVASMLPPSMVSKMASFKITSDAFLEEQRRSARRSRKSQLVTPESPRDQGRDQGSSASPQAAAGGLAGSAAAASTTTASASASASATGGGSSSAGQQQRGTDLAVEDTDSMPQRLVQPYPRRFGGREASLLMALCVTEASVSLFLAAKGQPNSRRVLLCGALGLLGCLLL